MNWNQIVHRSPIVFEQFFTKRNEHPIDDISINNDVVEILIEKQKTNTLLLLQSSPHMCENNNNNSRNRKSYLVPIQSNNEINIYLQTHILVAIAAIRVSTVLTNMKAKIYFVPIVKYQQITYY